MEAWIEDEFFTIKVPVEVMNKMKQKVEQWKSNGWYEFSDYGPQHIQGTLHISFAFNEEQVKIQGDEAILNIECKGTLDVDDEILRNIFLKELNK